MSLLDRASHGYRIGYRDAEANRPARTDLTPGTFAAYDYNEGYSAGWNAMYWQARRDNDSLDTLRNLTAAYRA